MLHIHWLARIDDINQLRNANLASLRLRAGALLTSLDARHHRLTSGEVITDDASICVIGKIGAYDAARRCTEWISQIDGIKQRGGTVILDYTDDHLSIESPMSSFYREAIPYADLCVCSSRLLARNLAQAYSGRIEVIPDAFEIAAIEPKVVAHSPVTILWFGHASNLEYLVKFIPYLSSDQPLKLMFMTNIEGLKAMQSARIHIPPNLRIEGYEWSVPSMIEASKDSDVCIIPSDPNDRRKAGVSSNRLLTAFALGLPTAADRMDSYIEHESMFIDLRSPAFKNLLKDPISFKNLATQAQSGSLQDHEMQNIGRRWLQVITEATAQTS